MGKKLLKQQINEVLVDIRTALPAKKKQLAERLCRLFGEWRRLCSSESREADVAKEHARAAEERLRTIESNRFKIAQQLEHLRKQAKTDSKRVRHLEDLLKEAKAPVSIPPETLTGLEGCVFEFEGRVAGAIPPNNRKDAIQFRINAVYSATRESPAWADIVVEQQYICMNPSICTPPFHRLFDCIAFAWHGYDRLAAVVDSNQACTATFQGQTFVFFAKRIAGRIVVMVDTEERIKCYVPGM